MKRGLALSSIKGNEISKGEKKRKLKEADETIVNPLKMSWYIDNRTVFDYY